MILLGFDVEEFDLPLEYGKTISFDEQLSVSTFGTLNILAILKQTGIKATFYCTANYALNKPEIVQEIVAAGHEIASHGYYHSEFKISHLKESKEVLESIYKTRVSGYRMARMMPVDEAEIQNAGYTYNSSINPTFIPGRYNNFNKPRSWFFNQGVLQIPASVSPFIRFPLFWLTFHTIPLPLIKLMASGAFKKDSYLNLYFHPWEFTDLNQEKYGLPNYIAKNSGENFMNRLKDFIKWAQKKGYQFGRTGDFANAIIQKQKAPVKD